MYQIAWPSSCFVSGWPSVSDGPDQDWRWCINESPQKARLLYIHAHDISRDASRADRRPYQCAHPHRRHLTVYLPRRHFCPSGKILGISPERHHPNEIIRFDIGWAIIVSLALVVHRHTKPDSPRVKLTDHVYGVQAVVYFYRA